MTSQKSLNWHKKIHNPISDQQCPYCEVKLRRKFTFIRHMKEEHGEEEPTESIEAQILKTFKKSDIVTELTHECVQCRKKFKRKRYLDYHIIKLFMNKAPHLNVCLAGKTTNSKKILRITCSFHIISKKMFTLLMERKRVSSVQCVENNLQEVTT